MPDFTLPLDGRTGRHFRLTPQEAISLHERGFKFSIFRPST